MGYQEAMMRHSIPVCWSLIKWGNMTSQSGYHLTKQILASAEKPTAIVCVNDNVALGSIFAIREAGLRCPEDISVTGHDNNLLLHSLNDIQVTSIDPLYDLIGERIAEKLVRDFWFDDSSIVEAKIIIGNSISQS